MKYLTLIYLLFINVVVYSQQDTIEKVLCKILNDYETEIIADSTYECMWVFFNGNFFEGDSIRSMEKFDNGNLVYWEEVYKCEWKHKTPTFRGFIKWLNKKND